jgi:hypothetical protein
MNETKVFLLKMMAESEAPLEFFLAYKALRRLDNLANQQPRPTAPMQGQIPTPTGFSNTNIPPHMPPPLNPNLAPRGPRPFREDELAPDYDQQGGLPWEGGTA